MPFTSIEIRENNEEMVDVLTLGFLIDPKYYHQRLSTESRIFLRKKTAEKLLRVQSRLGELRLKLRDGFRSRDVQNNLYQKYRAEMQAEHPDRDETTLRQEVGKFVSPPYQTDRIPPHTTGGTIDLTLADHEGNDVDMGTAFDFFGPQAQPLYFETQGNNPAVAHNRRVLREAMLAEGFTADADEWRHFDRGNQMRALKSGAEIAFYGEVTKEMIPDVMQ